MTASTLAVALGWGLLHGVDWDHIVAILDLTGAEGGRRRGVLLSALYAVGHGAVVIAIGLAAVVAGARLPSSVDSVAGQLVGLTLVGLGLWVLWRAWRGRRMRSPRLLLIDSVRRRLRRSRVVEVAHEHEHAADHHAHERVAAGPVAPAAAHSHRHVHRVAVDVDPFERAGPLSALGIGVIHGVGVETPTQILVLAAAAGAVGTGASIAYLVTFVVGLAITNVVMALGAARLTAVLPEQTLQRVLGLVVGVLSVGVGAVLLTGSDHLLPG